MANSPNFLEKNVILELCKGVHCVDLDESFQTHIYLQNLASIQPRTSPLKFVGSRYVAGKSRLHQAAAIVELQSGSCAAWALPISKVKRMGNSLSGELEQCDLFFCVPQRNIYQLINILSAVPCSCVQRLIFSWDRRIHLFG